MAVVKRNVFPVQPTAIKGNEINDRVSFGVKSQPCCVRSHGLLSASHRTTKKPPTTAANFTSCRSLARSPPALFFLRCCFWKHVGGKTDTAEQMLFHLLGLAWTEALHIVGAWIMAMWRRRWVLMKNGRTCPPAFSFFTWMKYAFLFARAGVAVLIPDQNGRGSRDFFHLPQVPSRTAEAQLPQNHHRVLIKTYLGQVITLPSWQEK